MTETKKMRAILRERGIEYHDVNSMVTDIEHDGIKTRVYDYDDGPDYQLCVEQKWLTAEEAVRVALGIKPQEVLERRIDELCAEVEALKRDEWAAGFNAGCEAVEAAYEDGKAHYEDENAKLVVKLNAEHIVRQNVEVENARLREQVDYMTPLALYAASERERDRMRELRVDA